MSVAPLRISRSMVSSLGVVRSRLQSPISTATVAGAVESGAARVSATGSVQTAGAPSRRSTRTEKRGPGAGSGQSRRWWAPRLSRRASALAAIRRATVAWLRTLSQSCQARLNAGPAGDGDRLEPLGDAVDRRERLAQAVGVAH